MQSHPARTPAGRSNGDGPILEPPGGGASLDRASIAAARIRALALAAT